MKKSMVLSTIAMIVIVVVALSTATYAWFTSTTTATATADFQANSASSELEIRAEGTASWSTSLVLGSLKNADLAMPVGELAWANGHVADATYVSKDFGKTAAPAHSFVTKANNGTIGETSKTSLLAKAVQVRNNATATAEGDDGTRNVTLNVVVGAGSRSDYSDEAYTTPSNTEDFNTNLQNKAASQALRIVVLYKIATPADGSYTLTADATAVGTSYVPATSVSDVTAKEAVTLTKDVTPYDATTLATMGTDTTTWKINVPGISLQKGQVLVMEVYAWFEGNKASNELGEGLCFADFSFEAVKPVV